MGRLGRKERRFLAEILYGFIRRDYLRVAEVHFEAGYVPAVHRVEDFAQAMRAIGEPIHARTADQISMAKLLTLLFEVTALFDMTTRIELVMLQKTMVVVEGVARKLDPHLDMWATAEPVVGGWIAENLGPRGRIEDLGRSVSQFAKLVADAPPRLERLSRLIERERRGRARRGAERASPCGMASEGRDAAVGHRGGACLDSVSFAMSPTIRKEISSGFFPSTAVWPLRTCCFRPYVAILGARQLQRRIGARRLHGVSDHDRQTSVGRPHPPDRRGRRCGL